MAVNAKFKYPDGSGNYETFHFETNADQVKNLGTAISQGIADISSSVTQVKAAQTKIENFLIGPSAIPIQSNRLVYNGQVKAPTFFNYDPIKMAMSGQTTGTNAGTYSVTFIPNELTTWEDGTTENKTVNWNILKAAPVVEASVNSVTLDDDHLTATFTVTTNSDGAVTVSTSDVSKVTASVANGVVTVSAVARSDEETLTITVAETQNYEASVITIPLVVDIAIALEDCTPQQIQQIIRAGKAASMWEVGDSVPVHLEGTIQQMAINGDYRIMILGINHNASLEGNNRVHFVIGKNMNGVNIAFCTPDYYKNGSSGTTAAKSFIMNPGQYTSTTDYNAGGWIGSTMHSKIMPQWKALLPKAWQDIITPVVKYTDNFGNKTDLARNVTPALDEFFLMSEFEVHGVRTYANSYEKNYQAQYAYYANGNSKIRYNHSDPSQAVCWWDRSPQYDLTYGFCGMYDDGKFPLRPGMTSHSFGVTPCFTVA